MNKFYVTTPIYYVNASPHLGHAYTDLVADAIARYHRKKGDRTFFLTGTDEHGAKIVRAAEKAGKPVEQFVEDCRNEFRSLLTLLEAVPDEFIYTADQERHWPGVRKLWNALFENGDIYKATYAGLYCVGHEAFVTEKDLVDGKCADHNQAPERIEEENYFFKLSKYAPDIRKAIESGALAIEPAVRKNEVLAFIDEGVADISFSRPSKDISWGIPVPHDPEHTIYVWADALGNYISALGYGREDDQRMREFWPADLHIIGKDILRFHAVIWPGILLAAGLPFPKKLFVHGMILSGGQKMSKTIGNVIDPKEMITEYGVDAFRYFMFREIPFGQDGDFTKERFADVYEGNLAHGLGNLVSRVAAMVKKYFPEGLAEPSVEALASVPLKRLLRQEVSEKHFELEGDSISRYFNGEIIPRYHAHMDRLEVTEAIKLLWSFYTLLDGYIQDYEPFRLMKTDQEKAAAVLWNLTRYIVESTDMLEPFLPGVSARIRESFGVGSAGALPDRFVVGVQPALFPSKKVRQ